MHVDLYIALCRLKHETKSVKVFFFVIPGVEIKDIPIPCQGCRIDWWVFRLDLITGNVHNTRMIGNQKEQMVETTSVPALCLQHNSLYCT